MTLPGIEVVAADSAPPRGPTLTLATPFIVAETERGPQVATPLRSLRDYAASYGARTATSAAVYDWLELFFREGGGRVYLSRLLGATAVVASKDLSNVTPSVALTVSASSPGSWGNGSTGGLKVQVVAGTEAGFVLVVQYNGAEVERSGDLVTGADAVAWSARSAYVTVTIGAGGGVPVVAAAANLTSGTDGTAPTGAQVTAALDQFGAALGPGHVVLPASQDTALGLLAAAHAATHNRIATLDGADTDLVATLTAQAATLAAGGHGDAIDLVTPFLLASGVAAGTARIVPASALRLARQAVNDGSGLSPNQPAAGRFGQASYASAVTRAWTDGDRETLNDAGVNVVRVIDGDVRLYGARTLASLATDPAGIRLGSARLRMAIVEVCRAEGERVAFEEVTEVALGNLEGNITGAVKRYIGSLYLFTVAAALVDGDTVGEYLVETSVEFQVKPDAERVKFTISRSIKEGA